MDQNKDDFGRDGATLAGKDASHEESETQAPHFSTRDARGGEIILRTRRRRAVFFAGLIAFVLLAVISSLAFAW